MSIKLATVCMTLPLIAACAHASVSDRNRTDNTAFDGYWEGDVSGTKKVQKIPGWDLTCGPVQLTLVGRVDQGKISGYIRQNENITYETNVNDAGRFYAAIPKKNKSYVPSPGSDATIPSEEFHVFRGQLDPATQTGSGRYVLARRNMLMEGCQTPIAFKKRG